MRLLPDPQTHLLFLLTSKRHSSGTPFLKRSPHGLLHAGEVLAHMSSLDGAPELSPPPWKASRPECSSRLTASL